MYFVCKTIDNPPPENKRSAAKKSKTIILQPALFAWGDLNSGTSYEKRSWLPRLTETLGENTLGHSLRVNGED